MIFHARNGLWPASNSQQVHLVLIDVEKEWTNQQVQRSSYSTQRPTATVR